MVVYHDREMILAENPPALYEGWRTYGTIKSTRRKKTAKTDKRAYIEKNSPKMMAREGKEKRIEKQKKQPKCIHELAEKLRKCQIHVKEKSFNVGSRTFWEFRFLLRASLRSPFSPVAFSAPAPSANFSPSTPALIFFYNSCQGIRQHENACRTGMRVRVVGSQDVSSRGIGPEVTIQIK